MREDRRPYHRESEDARREALVQAALDLVAEGGPKAATVRAIAERAGVTAGLIRHYFASKDDLVRQAYRLMMDRMTATTAGVLDDGPADPLERLASFVAASLGPPVVDPDTVGRWAGFLHGVRNDPEMRKVHIQTYLHYRDILQSLIEATGPAPCGAGPRALAIACNGVIDGLWMEASAVPEMFEEGEIVQIGLNAVSSILGRDLSASLAAAPSSSAPSGGLA